MRYCIPEIGSTIRTNNETELRVSNDTINFKILDKLKPNHNLRKIPKGIKSKELKDHIRWIDIKLPSNTKLKIVSINSRRVVLSIEESPLFFGTKSRSQKISTDIKNLQKINFTLL